ncbi:MAG: RidA family protein [Chloroflexi bacterium]|nr:MAG: RidA family protein [Chloroflexota bacterium]
MSKQIVSTENAPAAIGPYSQAVIANGFVFSAGQLGVVPQTKQFAGDDVQSQTRQALENLKAILEAAGSSLDKVVKVTVFLADINDFAAMNEVYATYFTENFPARSAVEVANLPLGGRVEIEAVAALD